MRSTMHLTQKMQHDTRQTGNAPHYKSSRCGRAVVRRNDEEYNTQTNSRPVVGRTTKYSMISLVYLTGSYINHVCTYRV